MKRAEWVAAWETIDHALDDLISNRVHYWQKNPGLLHLLDALKALEVSGFKKIDERVENIVVYAPILSDGFVATVLRSPDSARMHGGEHVRYRYDGVVNMRNECTNEDDGNDFDGAQGDKDDGGYKIKVDKIVTARVERTCCTCGGIVYIGTQVRVMTAIGPDGFVSSTDCHECCNAMALAYDGDDQEYCLRINKHRHKEATP